MIGDDHDRAERLFDLFVQRVEREEEVHRRTQKELAELREWVESRRISHALAEQEASELRARVSRLEEWQASIDPSVEDARRLVSEHDQLRGSLRSIVEKVCVALAAAAALWLAAVVVEHVAGAAG